MPILKNLDGMSRKHPTWIKQQIEKVVTHLITKYTVSIIQIIKQAFEDLDYVDLIIRRCNLQNR